MGKNFYYLVVAFGISLFFTSIEISNAAEKLLVAVIPFDGQDAKDTEIIAAVGRVEELLKKSDLFEVVEQSRISKTIEEQNLGASACKGACLVKTGMSLGADRVITGRMIKEGADRWRVSGQMVDVQTAQVLHSANIEYQGILEDMLINRFPDFVVKLADLPPVKEEGVWGWVLDFVGVYEKQAPINDGFHLLAGSANVFGSVSTKQGKTIDFSAKGSNRGLGYLFEVGDQNSICVFYHYAKSQMMGGLNFDFDSITSIQGGVDYRRWVNKFYIGGKLYTHRVLFTSMTADLSRNMLTLMGSGYGLIAGRSWDHWFVGGELLGSKVSVDLEKSDPGADLLSRNGESITSATVSQFYFNIGYRW